MKLNRGFCGTARHKLVAAAARLSLPMSQRILSAQIRDFRPIRDSKVIVAERPRDCRTRSTTESRSCIAHTNFARYRANSLKESFSRTTGSGYRR